MTRMAVQWLSGGRLHLSDGPIDLIIQAWGDPSAVAAAFQAAVTRTATILDELCVELPLLRSAATPHIPAARGAVARAMQRVVLTHTGFITPMAAVAGAVADAVLAAMKSAAPLLRAYVNNGGDIAIHLAQGEQLSVGLVDRPDRPSLFATALLRAEDGVGGVATSGWRGRSFSLGIADAVTVLAASAAAADAAATIIANAVDLPGHPAILRVPADGLDPDSDLGARPVTRGVDKLARSDIASALAAGTATAERLAQAGVIRAAALHVQGVSCVTTVLATERLAA